MNEDHVPVKQPLIPWVILGAIVLLLATASLVFRHEMFPQAPKPVKYSAVFLTNGQVYFGELKTTPAQLTLTNIYYLQTVQNGSNTQPSLVKLGSEIHGPEDKMTINNSSVLYYEDLRDDSNVVKTIRGK